MRNDKPNLVVSLSFQFASSIMLFSEKLENQKKYNLAQQLFRSGTSIGANIREAQNAESKKDFIHKMKIAAKEAEESYYWLLLCKENPSYPDTTQLLEDLLPIIKIVSKIIATSKNQSNLKNNPI